MELTRKCPLCEAEISYPNTSMYNRANRENRCCKACSYKKSPACQKRILSYDRNCPKCGKHLTYKVYFTWWWANKHDQPCRSCAKLGKTMPDGFSEKMSSLMRGENNPMYGRHHTQQVKDFISQNNRCNRSKSGQTTSEETREKMRTAKLKWIDEHGSGPAYNPAACAFMDLLKPDYNFQHALNGGEFRVCGYSVDGYDAEKNVVFEYDEPHHFVKKTWELKKRDIARMERIKKELGCTFLRYDERKNVLKEA